MNLIEIPKCVLVYYSASTTADFLGGRRSAPPSTLAVQPPQPPVTRVPEGKTPGEMTDDHRSQLNAVEKLQYQLTLQELQIAQRMAQSEQHAAEKVKVTVVSSSSESNEGELWLASECVCLFVCF